MNTQTYRKSGFHLFARLAVCLVLVLIVMTVSSGCRPSDKNSPDDGKLDVITTIFPPYDFARQIGGDHVNVTMLLPPGSESHTYEPTPREVVRIAKCDLFIYNGGLSDSWVERLLAAAELDPAKTLRMMDFVSLIEESEDGVLDHDHDHDEHNHEGESDLHEYDEHIWTNPQNALRISEGITEWLCETDPSHADYYRARMASYGNALRALDETFRDIVNRGARSEIIVADRFPLIYFTSAYKLDYMAAFPGCAAETDPKPKTVAAIIDKVRDDHIPYIFFIEFSSRQLSGLIAEETGAEELLFHTAHNVAKEDFEAGVTYLEIMKQNTENLRRGLGE